MVSIRVTIFLCVGIRFLSFIVIDIVRICPDRVEQGSALYWLFFEKPIYGENQFNANGWPQIGKYQQVNGTKCHYLWLAYVMCEEREGILQLRTSDTIEGNRKTADNPNRC